MLNTNDIYNITLNLLPAQIDLILDSLQLYAFNFHKVWALKYDSDIEELRNSLIFHTYQQIEQVYNTNKVNYDVLKACKLEHERKRKNNYKKIKKIA